MTPSLFDTINQTEWSEGALDMFAILTHCELSDELALVVICAAARLVAPDLDAAQAAYQFGRLVQDIQAKTPPPEPPNSPILAVICEQHAN
jgi:hypothetical protein